MLTAHETVLPIGAWKNEIGQNPQHLKKMIDQVYEKIQQYKSYNIWIHVCPKETIMDKIAYLEKTGGTSKYPLFGVPFAVKDNIDVAGVPTTAGCPEFSYIPKVSADAVKLLEEAGALMIGKTNLDQFATGLVGTRSPYGAVKNSYDPEYISGGSSSGSAVAVALGMVCFSLGTDTAGSGRVPAGFNNLFGLKPTKSRISTKGVVPACRTLDCISIFTTTWEDIHTVFNLIRNDTAVKKKIKKSSRKLTVGIPGKSFLQFFGDQQYENLFAQAVEKMSSQGAKIKEINFGPFQETAALLYEGPWVAERVAGIREFYDKNSSSMLMEIKTILDNAKKFTAVDTFLSLYKLEELKLITHEMLAGLDFLLVPTAPTIYRIDEINRRPFELNRNLGYYTNFVNLLHLCALAVPYGFQSNGLPMGVTLIQKAHHDEQLLGFARLFNA